MLRNVAIIVSLLLVAEFVFAQTEAEGVSSAAEADAQQVAKKRKKRALETERALERTLSKSGALLLPFGAFELEPGFQYTRTELQTVSMIEDTPTNSMTSSRSRQDEIDLSLSTRIGLWWDSQIELGTGYRYVHSSTVEEIFPSTGSATLEESTPTATGVGDLKVSLAKTLRQGQGVGPDIIFRLQYDGDNGEEQGSTSLGTGFVEYGASVLAMQRQDPLVFVSQLSYRASEKKEGIAPGPQYQLVLSMDLAASPTTALSFSLDQTYVAKSQIAGVDVPGSDQLAGFVSVGASTLMGPGVLVSISGGVGITEDSPDYFLSVGVPVRY